MMELQQLVRLGHVLIPEAIPVAGEFKDFLASHELWSPYLESGSSPDLYRLS